MKTIESATAALDREHGPEGEALARERRRALHGFAAGVLTSAALALLACATAGSRSDDAAAARPPEETATATASTTPVAAPAPATAAAAPAAPAAPAEASASAASPSSPAAAPGSVDAASRVAALRADPPAMLRASQLFRAVCTGYCHSTQAAADRVAPNLFDCEWAHGGSDEEIFHTLSAGVPDTQMQGFGERLPDDDLWKLVAYLRQKSTCQ